MTLERGWVRLRNPPRLSGNLEIGTSRGGQFGEMVGLTRFDPPKSGSCASILPSSASQPSPIILPYRAHHIPLQTRYKPATTAM